MQDANRLPQLDERTLGGAFSTLRARRDDDVWSRISESLEGDSLDSDRDELLQGSIQRCGGKKFCASIPCRHTHVFTTFCMLARAIRDARDDRLRARPTCKKTAFHKGFLHGREIRREIPRDAQYIAPLDKQWRCFARDTLRLHRAR